MSTAATFIIAILGSGGFATIVTFVFTRIAQKLDNKDAIKHGVQLLLYDRIKCKCQKAIERGEIPSDVLEDLEREWKCYHNELDGNGFLDAYMNKVRELPITK